MMALFTILGRFGRGRVNTNQRRGVKMGDAHRQGVYMPSVRSSFDTVANVGKKSAKYIYT